MNRNKENQPKGYSRLGMHDLRDCLGLMGMIAVISVSLYEQNLLVSAGTAGVATAVNTFMEWKAMQKEKRFMNNHKP